MAHNSYLRSSNFWASGSTLTHDEMAAFDRAQFKSVNGDDGGVYNPIAQIQIGGQGLWATNFSAGGASAGAPAFTVSGSTFTLQNGTSFVAVPGAKYSGPGSAFTITDGQPPVYTPARSFTNRAVPYSLLPALIGSDITASMAGGNLGRAVVEVSGQCYLELSLPPGALITALTVRVQGMGSSAAYVAQTGQGRAALFSYSYSDAANQYTTILDPTSTYATWTVPHDIVLTPGNGGLPPGGLTVDAATHYQLWLAGPLNTGLFLSAVPFITGSLPNLRVV